MGVIIEGKYEHNSPPEVTIVFKGIRELPRVSIGRYGKDIPPGMDELDPGTKGAVVQYYMIDSNIVSEEIEIRILARLSDPEVEGEIFQWSGKHWDRLEFQEWWNVGKYKLIIGKTDHLSGFGIRT